MIGFNYIDGVTNPNQIWISPPRNNLMADAFACLGPPLALISV